MSARASRAARSSCVQPPESRSCRKRSIIVGNTVLYGAITRASAISAASRASVSPCATRAHRGRRGRGRSRLRIHDRRRACVVTRPDRAQLRGRHVGRHRLCARSEAGDFESRLQQGDGRTGAGHAPIRRRSRRSPACRAATSPGARRRACSICASRMPSGYPRAHRRATRSTRIRRGRKWRSSTDLQAYLPKFVKVMPVEYRRALTRTCEGWRERWRQTPAAQRKNTPSGTQLKSSARRRGDSHGQAEQAFWKSSARTASTSRLTESRVKHYTRVCRAAA